MYASPPEKVIRHSIELATGQLDIRVDRAEWPLEELCGFASRYNRLRGYLFVSKVLGKHCPVRPRVMAALYEALAGQLAASALPGPVVTVALAETATGLGQGVFEACLEQYQWEQAVFLPTTRYALNRPALISIDETHCHAPTHLLYEPAEPRLAQWLRQARTLILVDDEMSTGNTFLNLARAFQQLAPGLEKVVLLTITCWLGAAGRAALAGRFPVPVEFASLLDGSFEFVPKEAEASLQKFKSVGDWGDKSSILLRDHGRLGLGPQSPAPDMGLLRRSLRLDRSRPVSVLGTGEFLYQPYRLASLLEAEGFEVNCQASTRTPIALGGDINSVLQFEDNYHDGIDNFLYNVSLDENRQFILAYETSPLPPNHRLAELLKAQTIFF